LGDAWGTLNVASFFWYWDMQQQLLILALGAIAMITLPACSTVNGGSATSNTIGANNATATNGLNQTQTAIKAGGSSSSVDFLQTLRTAYESSVKTVSVSLLEPSQSENVIAGVKQGLIDLGALSKTLNPEEIDGIEFRAIAQDALLVATHATVTGVKNLTTTQLKGIYSGKITNWKELGGPDAAIVVLDRPEDESAKRLLRQHYLGDDLVNGPNAVVLRKEGELIQTLQSTEYSIGAFSLAHAIIHRLPVNRLNLDDIAPTPQTLKTGQYPMVRTIGLIWRKNATEATQSLVQYVFSPAGTAVLTESGFAPTAVATAATP
jgi:phosphate transport system substrate-binding protein